MYNLTIGSVLNKINPIGTQRTVLNRLNKPTVEDRLKMIFQLVQRNLSILGISKLDSDRSFRIKVLIGCFLQATHIAIRLIFLFHEANGFREYSESIFMISVTVVDFWAYANLVYKRKELFEFIDGSEKLVILFKESKLILLHLLHLHVS